MGHSRLRTELLPKERTVLEFRFVDHSNRYWLVVEPSGTSICDYDPGFGIEAVITSGLFTLHMVWSGREAIRTALIDERISWHGHPGTVKQLPDVLTPTSLGEMAEAARAAAVRSVTAVAEFQSSNK